MASYLARGRLHRTTLRANLLVLQARAPRSGISSSRTLPLRVSAFSPSAVEQSPQQCASLVAGALSKFRALVVDSSYRPIDILSWERAICLDLYQKADVLEYYDVQVRSPSIVLPLPAVIRVNIYVDNRIRDKHVSISRRNILLRDKFTCQYCNHSNKNHTGLTIDHVTPLSKGGDWSWSNLVTACASCNAKKGSKTLKQLGGNWKLKRTPREPSGWEIGLILGQKNSSMSHQSTPEEWRGYLPPGNGAEWVI